jgi:hypothetical protein
MRMAALALYAWFRGGFDMAAALCYNAQQY